MSFLGYYKPFFKWQMYIVFVKATKNISKNVLYILCLACFVGNELE